MAVIEKLTEETLQSALQGRNILIIGGTAGLGKALAIAALARGAKVTVVGRRNPGTELASAKFIQKDLSLMKNAAALASEIDTTELDTLVFTIGIFASPARRTNDEGIELDLAVSYLSRFVFAREILNKGFGSRRADTTKKPRIFVMGFPGQKLEAIVDDFNAERSYSAWPVHANTVVANEAFVSYLNKEFKGDVNVYGLNPGLIKTEIRDNFLGKGSWKSWIVETLIGWFSPSPQYYAENTLVHALASPQLEDKTGAYIDQKRKIISGNPWLTEEKIQRVMEESAKLADRALGRSA